MSIKRQNCVPTSTSTHSKNSFFLITNIISQQTNIPATFRNLPFPQIGLSMEQQQHHHKPLHIVMFPWLAIGHLRPFFNLSTALAEKGHHISFISTPRNLQRCIRVPHHLSHLIHLITLPLPPVDHLPPGAESSMDVSHVQEQLLKVAFDLLQPPILGFLQTATPKPDWVVYDYASHWLAAMAADLGISRAYFSLFTAAFMAFLGSPETLIKQEIGRSTAEDFTVVPPWIPSPSNLTFRLHEMTKNMEKDADGNEYSSGTSDSVRFGMSIDGSDIVIFRSVVEFEPEWFDVVHKLYQKPVIPIGVMPVEEIDDESESESESDRQKWRAIKQWLDQHEKNSVVYVAVGTEAVLSAEELLELALGLEQCGLPFLWVLNRDHLFKMLPDGFRDRVAGRGVIQAEWAPQNRILAHPAVGGFLTHCGWNSVTEALRFGRVLILLPLMNEQGLNARLLEEKAVGMEIPRDERRSGAFSRDEVAATVRSAVVGEEGTAVRENARRAKALFGDRRRTSAYIDNLLQYMTKRE